MQGTWNIVRVLLMAAIIVTVSQVSARFPRAGALILSLPIVSILAILLSWQQHHQLHPLSTLARETLILVPLGLPLFVPLAFANRLGLGFWTAMGLGLLLAGITIGSYLALSTTD